MHCLCDTGWHQLQTITAHSAEGLCSPAAWHRKQHITAQHEKVSHAIDAEQITERSRVHSHNNQATSA